MKKIYKYPLEIADSQDLKLPCGSEILSAQEQYNKIVIYALVEDYPNLNFLDTYSIQVNGTGYCVITDGYTFLDTVNLHDGTLMYHIFYKKQ